MDIKVKTQYEPTTISKIKENHILSPRITSVVFFLFLFMAVHGIVPLYASADEVSLEWQRSNPAADIVSYKIYYRTDGTGSRILANYTETGLVFDGPPRDGDPVDSGIAIDQNQLTQNGDLVYLNLRNLDPTQTYCFVVTAYDNQNESSPSNETCRDAAPPDTAPSVSMLSVNEATGATPVYTNDAGRQVNVRIVADDETTVSEYAILEDMDDPGIAAFTSVPGGPAANIDITLPFTLADADRNRTLYAWVRDNTGNVSSSAVKVNVVLDRALPVSTINLPVDAARLNNLSTISGTSSDNVTTVSAVSIQVTDGVQYLRADDTWTSSPTWFAPDHSADPTNWWHDTTGVSFQSPFSYTIRSRAIDMAGNTQNPVNEITFTYDEVPPAGNVAFSPSDTSHVPPGVFNISANFNESLASPPAISISGAGPLAVSNAPMSGAGNSWSYAITVPFNDRTAYTVTISNAVDIGGNPISLLGNFTTDTIDTDGDGLRDYMDDNDDDNDGWTDDFELQMGFNPLVDDRNGDLDGDGYTNSEEIAAGTDPSNQGPNQPVLIPIASPSSVAPELATLPYSDDEGDAHVTTIWQISTDSAFSDNVQFLFHLETDDFLESVRLPGLILTPESGVTYYWRVQFIDSQNGPSLWSNMSSFTTGTDPDDANADGIPDDNVGDNTIDLNGDGTNEVFSVRYRAVRTAVGDNVIGVEVVTPGVQIDYLKALSPGDISDPYGRPASLPIGLVNFRLSGVTVGGMAEVIIRPLNPIDNMTWYYYDLSTGWLDYSANTVSNPGGSLSITLMDGDVGDCDGAANGVIVDPFGPGGSGGRGGSPAAPSLLGDVGAGGGGCFIATAAYGSPMERQVQHLSNFRDQFMLPNMLGKKCVEFYYKHSPSLADYIRERPALKQMARTVLAPVAALAYLAVHELGLLAVFAGLSVFAVISAGLCHRIRNTRMSGDLKNA